MVNSDQINRNELRVELLRAGISSNADLSRITGISRGALSSFFNGRTPHYNTIIKIAKAAKLSEEQFNEIFFNYKLA